MKYVHRTAKAAHASMADDALRKMLAARQIGPAVTEQDAAAL
jgi:hypothetical protein